MYGVLIRFSPTGCISIRIAVTLGYEKLLVCGCQHIELVNGGIKGLWFGLSKIVCLQTL
jgi:hypothetical protein